MRASLIALAAAGLLGGSLGPAPFNPAMQPLRAAQGGTYDGRAGSGYDAATLMHLASLRGADIPARPDYGWLGRVTAGDTGTHGGTVVREGTIAPVAHWLWPLVTDHLFGADLPVRMTAFAAAAAGIRGGVDKVRCYVEGNSYDVAVPSAQPIERQGGDTCFFPGYDATLLAASLNEGDGVDLYWEVFATLPGIANRVIGPMRVYRKSAFDQVVTIDSTLAGDVTIASNPAAAQYRDVRTALNDLAAGAWPAAPASRHVLLQFRQDPAIDLATPFANHTAVKAPRRGQVHLDMASGQGSIGASAWAPMKLGYSGLVLRNMTIDEANIAAVEPQNALSYAFSRPLWIDRCEITTGDPAGRYEAPGAFGRGAKAPRLVTIFNQAPVAVTRSWLHDCCPGDLYVPIFVGNRVDNLPRDVMDLGGNQPYGILGNVVTGVTGFGWSTPIPALDLAYTGSDGAASFDMVGTQGAGAAAAVTLSCSVAGASFDITGSHGSRVPSQGARTLTLRDGSNVQSFTLGATYGATTLSTMADLVAIVNAVGGTWTAAATVVYGTAVSAATLAGYSFAKLGTAAVLAGTGTAIPAATPLTWQDPRTLVLRNGGVPVVAFPSSTVLGATGPSGTYFIDDYTPAQTVGPLVAGTTYTGLVSAINAWANGNGWSAAVNPAGGARLAFAYASAPLAFAPTATSTALAQFTGCPVGSSFGSAGSASLCTGLDVHCDTAQASANQNHDNMLHGGNVGLGNATQPMFPAIWAGWATFNTAFVLNALENDMANMAVVGNAYSQISGTHRHILIAHCSTPNMGLAVRSNTSDIDATSRVVANALNSLSADTPAMPAAAWAGQMRWNVVSNIYNAAGGAVEISGTGVSDNRFLRTGVAAGSAAARLATMDTADFPALADYPAGNGRSSGFAAADFRPAAGGPRRLPANLVPSQVACGLDGTPFAPLDLAGAVPLAA